MNLIIQIKPFLQSLIYAIKKMFIIFFLLIGNNLFATKYFISTSGSDAADGSAGYPWKTLSHASKNVRSGDIIFINSGIYTPESQPAYIPSGVSIDGAGESSHLIQPLIILDGIGGNQNISNIKIDGNNVINHNAILIKDRHDIIISNCIFQNFKDGNLYYATEDYQYPIELRNTHNIEIHHNTIEGGIRSLYNNKNLNIHHNTIGKSLMNNIPEIGIYLCDVDNIHIWNNKFKNLSSFIEISSYGSTNVRNVYIYCNVMVTAGIIDKNIWGYGSGIRFGGLTKGSVRNINIVHNTIVGNPQDRFTMVGIWLPTVGNGKMIVIRNNILEGFQYASIFAAGPEPRMDSVFIDNNILYGNAVTGRSYAPDNLPYYTNMLLPLHITQHNNILSDPLFVSNSDYHITYSSPGIETGIFIPWIETYHDDDDYFDPPYIGAYRGYPKEIIIEPTLEDLLLIYPVPATNYVTIISKNPMFNPNRIQFIDISGKVVIDQRMDSDILHNFPIDLKSGFYLVRILNNVGGMIIGKIIVK